jgi:hypothetical protein
MKHVFKQMARSLAALLAVYGALLAITLILVPRASAGHRLDTARAASSLFLTEPKYVFLARGQLNTSADKVLLLGASNMLAGFRQEQVQALVPECEVHNLAVGGSNIRQVEQIVELVREVQTPVARRHDRFVIGLWYGLFASDEARWHGRDRQAGDTDIDIERYRYGFYRRTPSGPVPLLPPRDLNAGVLLIHPYLVLDRAARDVTQTLRDLITEKPPAMTDAQRNAVVLTEAEKRKYLAFWHEYMGSVGVLDASPFRVLGRVVDGILAQGGQVVLVDMPIPEWHSRGSALWADYRKRMDELLAGLQARVGVAILRMEDADAEQDFRDEVHPKPRVTPRWAERLAVALNANATLRRTAAANASEPTLTH